MVSQEKETGLLLVDAFKDELIETYKTGDTGATVSLSVILILSVLTVFAVIIFF